jgi:putative DNA primase/helicase
MSVCAARFAKRYCEIGLTLTFTMPATKGPRHHGWNLPENAIADPQRAFGYWLVNPTHGMAALLGPSGLVSLDVDDEQYSPHVLKNLGISLEQLRESTPTIIGRHYRLMFKAPHAELKHRTLSWPRQDDPRKGFALFELRAGNLADTLPPTRHAVTGLPYRWENPPMNGFPTLPTRLLEIWQDWETVNRQARALCPWAPPPKETPRPKERAAARTGPSVIAEFNAAHDIGQILERHGYVRRGKRFASPETSHGAGVVLLDDGRVFCHHQGDPLHGEHALDAFDIYRVLEHGGDYRCAVKAAAEALGLNQEARHGHR